MRPYVRRAPQNNATDPKRHPLCNILRDARVDRGLTLPDVARKCGLPAVVIGSYERGDRDPPLGKLCQWAIGVGFDLQLIPRAGSGLDQEVGTEWRVALPSGRMFDACDEETARSMASMIGHGAIAQSRIHRATKWRDR